jgi:hypothetical protein
LFALSAAVMSITTGARAAGGPSFALQGSFTGSSDAFFGYSVATDGNTAVVGAANDNGNKGAAYVYVLTGSTWTLQQELTAPDGATGDEFGYEVAISGNTAIVAADEKDSGQGYVYVFSRTGTTWAFQTEFTSGDGAAGDCFGCSIALRGSTALVGADGRLGGTGGAYLFTGSGSSWTLQQEFAGTGSSGAFGAAVALSTSGQTAVVGAPGVSSSTGEAFVYTSSGGAWSQQATLTASGGSAGDYFGFSVAVDGSTALIGAFGASGNEGAAYVFTGSAGTWSQEAKLQASIPKASDQFGWSVALNGTTALVGAYELVASGDPGAAYLFTNGGGVWSQQQELAAPVAGQDFGYAVALSSSAAVVGAFGESNDGGAYIYAPVIPSAAPAMGPGGSACLLLLLLGAAFWSMSRRTGRGAIALGLLVATNACSAGADGASGGSGENPPTNQGPSSGTTGSEDTGSVGMQLTLPGGENISVIHWAITGPNGTTNVVQSSSVTVQALSIHFLVGDIPAGSGYLATLSGTSTDSTVSCTGSAPFNVTAHATTLVSVQLACGELGTGGHGTNVNGTTFNCAAWSSVTANPTETKVGTPVALAATANGPDPTMLTYAWSSSTGSFTTPNSATSNFTCTQVGPAAVTLTVGDGPVPSGSTCNPSLDTTTITVTCDAGSTGDAGTGPPAAAPAAPAVPLWGILLLAAAMLGMGFVSTRFTEAG